MNVKNIGTTVEKRIALTGNNRVYSVLQKDREFVDDYFLTHKNGKELTSEEWQNGVGNLIQHIQVKLSNAEKILDRFVIKKDDCSTIEIVKNYIKKNIHWIDTIKNAQGETIRKEVYIFKPTGGINHPESGIGMKNLIPSKAYFEQLEKDKKHFDLHLVTEFQNKKPYKAYKENRIPGHFLPKIFFDECASPDEMRRAMQELPMSDISAPKYFYKDGQKITNF